MVIKSKSSWDCTSRRDQSLGKSLALKVFFYNRNRSGLFNGRIIEKAKEHKEGKSTITQLELSQIMLN